MNRAFGAAMVLLMACGGGSTASTSATESSGGEANIVVGAVDDPAPERDSGPVEEPPADIVEAPAPSGSAKVIVRVKVAGEDVAAPVQVLALSGKVVAEGRAGSPIEIPAGTYELSAAVEDPKLIIGAPKKKSSPRTITAGETMEEVLEMPAAKVKLRVLKKGRPVAGATVKLSRAGAIGSEVVAEFPVTDDFIRVAAGRYDALIVLKNEQVEVKGLVFPAGATREMPININ